MTPHFLKNFKFSMYGESHSKSIGGIITGIPSNFSIDLAKIQEVLLMRNPKNELTTARQDKPKIIIESGYVNNKTTGTPLMFRLENNNVQGKDYDTTKMRIDHTDYVSYQKYGENYPYAGGGPFSGRMTAVIVVIGEIARQILSYKKKDIQVDAQILEVGEIKTKSLLNYNQEEINKLENDFFILDPTKKQEVLNYLTTLANNNNTSGAKIEIKIKALKQQIGDIYFDSLESVLSSAMFSIPGIKGINFGIGDEFYQLQGEQLVERIKIENKQIIPLTNINGGINGGITNGYQDIYFTLTTKPPLSNVQGIQILKKTENEFKVKEIPKFGGRHDNFIAPKMIYAIKSWIYIILLDQMN